MKIPGDYDPVADDEPEIAVGLPKEFTRADYERQRATEQEMLARQDLVANYKTIAPNLTMEQMRIQLKRDGYDVSISTISRDVKEIEDRSWLWSDRLAMSGFVWSCQEAVKRNDNLIAQLSMGMETTTDYKDKAIIARTINELQMSKLNLQGRATYIRLKKARDKYMSAEALSTELRRE